MTANGDVYGIPMLFIVGWRGEPGVKDEPQHVFQGKITCELFETLAVPYSVIDQNTTDEEMDEILQEAGKTLAQGDHDNIFMTVGGMGHASMIALGIAKNRKDKKIVCIDGDGRIGEWIREKSGPLLWEIPVSLGSRSDLGRPKESARENKEGFMRFLK